MEGRKKERIRETHQKVNVEGYLKSKSIPVEDLAWCAFKMLLAASDTFIMSKYKKQEFDSILSHLMHSKYSDKKQFIKQWLYEHCDKVFIKGNDEKNT